MKNHETLVAVGGLAATLRRVTRERNEAMLAAYRDGWSFAEIARVTGVDRRRVSEFVHRLEAQS